MKKTRFDVPARSRGSGCVWARTAWSGRRSGSRWFLCDLRGEDGLRALGQLLSLGHRLLGSLFFFLLAQLDKGEFFETCSEARTMMFTVSSNGARSDVV